MSVRQEVADKLSADNPTFIVKAHPVSEPENIPAGKVWINVYRERIEVAPNDSHIIHHLKVSVVIPKKNSEAAENELEAALDAVLYSLQALPDVYWSDAQRQILGASYESYEITLHAARSNVYKTQFLTA